MWSHMNGSAAWSTDIDEALHISVCGLDTPVWTSLIPQAEHTHYTGGSKPSKGKQYYRISWQYSPRSDFDCNISRRHIQSIWGVCVLTQVFSKTNLVCTHQNYSDNQIDMGKSWQCVSVEFASKQYYCYKQIMGVDTSTENRIKHQKKKDYPWRKLCQFFAVCNL